MNIDSKYDRGTPVSTISLERAYELLANFLGGRTIQFFEQMSGGYLNTNYKLIIEGVPYVLRISNRGGEAMAVEAGILKNLNIAIPSPRLVFFENRAESESIESFSLLSYFSGKPLYLVEDEFCEDDIKCIGRDLGKILATIHNQAFSGPYLYDLGNFFRFENEMPPYKEHLIEAYLQNGGLLPSDWREVARFLDLLPQLQFLAREADTPQTFKTARSVIRETLSLSPLQYP